MRSIWLLPGVARVFKTKRAALAFKLAWKIRGEPSQYLRAPRFIKDPPARVVRPKYRKPAPV